MWPTRCCLSSLSDSFGKCLTWVVILAPTFVPAKQKKLKVRFPEDGKVVALTVKIGFYWVTLQSAHFAFLLTKLNFQPKYWKGNTQAERNDSGGLKSEEPSQE